MVKSWILMVLFHVEILVIWYWRCMCIHIFKMNIQFLHCILSRLQPCFKFWSLLLGASVKPFSFFQNTWAYYHLFMNKNEDFIDGKKKSWFGGWLDKIIQRKSAWPLINSTHSLKYSSCSWLMQEVFVLRGAFKKPPTIFEARIIIQWGWQPCFILFGL